MSNWFGESCLILYSRAQNYIITPQGVTNFLNTLPDNVILGLPKLKAFADDKLNVTQNVKVVFHRIENIVGKEENAGYQHFLVFLQCFQKASSTNESEVIIVW